VWKLWRQTALRLADNERESLFRHQPRPVNWDSSFKTEERRNTVIDVRSRLGSLLSPNRSWKCPLCNQPRAAHIRCSFHQAAPARRRTRTRWWRLGKERRCHFQTRLNVFGGYFRAPPGRLDVTRVSLMTITTPSLQHHDDQQYDPDANQALSRAVHPWMPAVQSRYPEKQADDAAAAGDYPDGIPHAHNVAI
jgi:hypothetical protein